MKNGKINYFTEVAIYSKKIKCPFMHFHGMNFHVLLLSQWIQLSTCILYKLGSIKAGAMYLIHLYILRRKRLTHNRQPCAEMMNLTLSSESVLDWILSKYGNHKPSLQLKEFLRAKKKKSGEGEEGGWEDGEGSSSQAQNPGFHFTKLVQDNNMSSFFFRGPSRKRSSHWLSKAHNESLMSVVPTFKKE